MTRASNKCTPSNWAATRNLVSRNKSRTGHKQASKLSLTHARNLQTQKPKPRTIPLGSNLRPGSFEGSHEQPPTWQVVWLHACPTCLSTARGWLNAPRRKCSAVHATLNSRPQSLHLKSPYLLADSCL